MLSRLGPVAQPLILQSVDRHQLDQLSDLDGLEVTADLSIIDSLAVKATPNAIHELMTRSLTDPGLKLYCDDEVQLIRPIVEEVSPALDTGTPVVNAPEMWEKGVTGKGVTVAILDTGIAPHNDVKDRIIGFHDVINGRREAYDDQGHGTHVAGIVAGNGSNSGGLYKGAAPEASLVGIKVLSGSGRGSLSGIIRGIQWAIRNKDRYQIKVLNMSLGARVREGYKNDPIAQAVKAAHEAGITVVVAAGNSGSRPETIGTPAHSPFALTVGADDDRGTRTLADDRVASFSSRGPTPVDGLTKPDVVAPGVRITAPDNDSSGYVTLSGTSMAAPMTAGVAALLLQANPGSSPDEIKNALKETARPIRRGGDENQQGQGVIDAVAASQQLESARLSPALS